MDITGTATPQTVKQGQTLHLTATATASADLSNFKFVFWFSSGYNVVLTWGSSLVNLVANEPASQEHDWVVPSDLPVGSYTFSATIYDPNGIMWKGSIDVTVVSGSITPACGTANGAASLVAPSVDLCAAGTPTGVSDNHAGQWVWSCNGSTSPVSCSAPIGTPGPGVCGAANNTTIPDMPNQSLCASGATSIVTGTGPWFWTCIGLGSGAGQNQSCMANICQACVGSATTNVTGPTTTGVVAPGGCTVHGFASWMETDAISPSNTPVQLQWNDPFNGTFTRTINPVPAPATYCPPCYQNLKSVSNAQVAVWAAPGSCPADPALNSGDPVSYPATNVTVTPQ